jgi:tripartite-type tricarboxylate transporter receptor subunit TctC
MEDQGIDVMPSTSEEFVAFVKEETAKWKKVVKEAGLVGDQ